MTLRKIDFNNRVSVMMNTENPAQDYIEIRDYIDSLIDHDEHTHTFDVKMSDIQELIDLLKNANKEYHKYLHV